MAPHLPRRIVSKSGRNDKRQMFNGIGPQTSPRKRRMGRESAAIAYPWPVDRPRTTAMFEEKRRGPGFTRPRRAETDGCPRALLLETSYSAIQTPPRQ
jgi:hypothetical protein